jgi:acid stress-induced BolA-like protein IbaG/YrbA
MLVRCPSCQKMVSLRLVEATVTGTGYQYNAVVCSSCMTALNVVESHNNSALLLKLQNEVKQLQQRLHAR